MALTKTVILIGAGALALLLFGRKREIMVPGMSTVPHEPHRPDGSKTPPVSPDGSTTPDGASVPSGPGWLGYDPFPPLAMALVVGPVGNEWWAKHPLSGRWGPAGVDFGPLEGYRSIGMLARNHNVVEVQNNKGVALWKPFVWNAYGFPVGTPLQFFA